MLLLSYAMKEGVYSCFKVGVKGWHEQKEFLQRNLSFMMYLFTHKNKKKKKIHQPLKYAN